MPTARGSAPTTILLVRHGQTATTGKVLPGRAPGLHLSDAGRTQAHAVAARIGSDRVAAVYASPMERTQETAAPIAKACGRRVRTERGLIECDFGEWTGGRLSDLRRRREWQTVQQHPSGFRFPGGESFLEMQARMVRALDLLCRRHPSQTVVAVSHADPIKAAAAHALGMHLDAFQRIVISPCSVTAVTFTGAGPIVLTVNDSGNLAGLRPS